MSNDLQTNLDIIDDFTQRLQVAVIGAEETTAKHEKWVEGTDSEVIQTANGPIKTLRGLIADWRATADQSVATAITGYDQQFQTKLNDFDVEFINYLLTVGFEPAIIYQPGITITRRPQTVAYQGVTYYWGGALPYTTTGNFATEPDWLIAQIIGGIEIPQMSFASGGTIVRKTQSVLGSDGEWYFWTGSFPKVVAAGSTLESAGGVGLNKFKLASGHVPVRPMMKILSTAAGYVLNSGSFEYGATITSSSQVLPELNTGRIWKWDGPIPKVVDLNSSPASSGGVGENLWNEVVTATGSSGSGITIGATKPTGVGSGHRWFCTTDGRTYVYFADGDSVQWVEESPQNSVFDGLEPRVRESLRRSYAEAGYNVVGTFQGGFTLVNANDVGIDETTGKGFSGPAGPVAAGTDPLSGGFVDRSGALWRPKTPDDFTGTDQQKIEAWLATGGDLEIRRDYTMTSVVAVAVSNARISGHGRIIFPATVSTSGTALSITGNNNKFKEIHIIHEGSMLNAGALVTVTGNKNRLENVESTFLTEYNPTVEGQQYKGTCIALVGDSNSAIECYGENGGTGVGDNGKNNLLLRNTFNKSCRIVVNGNRSRHAIVDGNTGDCQHKGYPLQGCDGIWGNRSHRFTKYSNNTILNPGEHGAYLQGDGFTWDKTNRVEGAKKCLLKVGAKAEGNFAYPGETLPLFNEFGVPDAINGVYATTGAFIAPRGSGNNTIASSDGCVCLQPNIADLVIDEYEVVDNPDSPFGIRSLYFAYGGAGLQVMSNLKVLDGKVLRSGSSSFACADNLEIDGFYSGQKLNISAADAPQGTKNVTIRAECPYIDFTTAPDGIKILGGKYRYILESSGLNIEIFDAEITSQNTGGAWANGRVVRLQDSKVTWLGASVFNINGVNNIVDSTFDLPDANVSYPLQFNFNSNRPLQGHFDGNTIRAPLSERPVRIGGSDATCNSNVIVGSASAIYTLTIQGSNVTAVGNALNAGAVRLEAGSSNCNVNARSVNASGSGHSVFADSCTLSSDATNCFVVGKTVTNNNPTGGNVVITS